MNGLTRDEAIDLHTELLSKLTRVNLAVSALTRTADKIDSILDRVTALEKKMDTITQTLETREAKVDAITQALEKREAITKRPAKRARSHSPRSSPPPPFEPSPPAPLRHEELQRAVKGALARLNAPSFHQVEARLVHCLEVLHQCFAARTRQVSDLSARPMATLLSEVRRGAQGFLPLASFFFARLSSPKVLAVYNTASAKALLDSHTQCRAVDTDDVGAYLLCVERKVEGKVVDMAYAGGATKSFTQRWTQHQQEQEKRLTGQERQKGHLYHTDNLSWAMLAITRTSLPPPSRPSFLHSVWQGVFGSPWPLEEDIIRTVTHLDELLVTAFFGTKVGGIEGLEDADVSFLPANSVLPGPIGSGTSFI